MSATILSSEALCRKLSEMHTQSPLVRFSFCDIKASAESGCTLCCVIYDSVTAHADKTKMTLSPNGHASVTQSGLHVTYANTVFELFSLQDNPLKPKAIPIANNISGYTGSDESFKRAVEWLKNCLKNHHTLCGGPKSGHQFPNRILDLGILSTSGKVKLLETSADVGNYACLSHCWGTTRPLLTTSATLEQRKSGIPFDIIPKTFQDAIKFTARLGIRYIWIDTLCIVQDDKEDWRRESALMADIYRNAIITLAASAATGSNDGLYNSSDPVFLSRELSLLHNRADHQGIYVRRNLEHFRRGLALLSRGWVFQERLLSPRVLHFGHSELLWECMEQNNCECSGMQGVLTLWFSAKKFYCGALLDIFPPRRLANIWREIVQDYSKMNLTQGKDIFPAISGAAKTMQAVIKSKYLAGLWEHNIIEDLMWSTSEPEQVKRPSEWRSPTFSWASTASETSDRGIQYRLMSIMTELLGLVPDPQNANRERVYAKLVEANCTLAGPDRTGELLSGYITLEGPLIRGLVKEAKDSFSSLPYEIYFPGQSKLPNQNNPDRIFPDYNWVSKGDSEVKPGSTVFCLKLVSIKAISRQRQYLIGLILRRVNDVDKVYERIGLLKYMESLEPDIETWFETAEVENNAVVKII